MMQSQLSLLFLSSSSSSGVTAVTSTSTTLSRLNWKHNRCRYVYNSTNSNRHHFHHHHRLQTQFQQQISNKTATKTIVTLSHRRKGYYHYDSHNITVHNCNNKNGINNNTSLRPLSLSSSQQTIPCFQHRVSSTYAATATSSNTVMTATETASGITGTSNTGINTSASKSNAMKFLRRPRINQQQSQLPHITNTITNGATGSTTRIGSGGSGSGGVGGKKEYVIDEIRRRQRQLLDEENRLYCELEQIDLELGEGFRMDIPTSSSLRYWDDFDNLYDENENENENETENENEEDFFDSNQKFRFYNNTNNTDTILSTTAAGSEAVRNATHNSTSSIDGRQLRFFELMGRDLSYNDIDEYAATTSTAKTSIKPTIENARVNGSTSSSFSSSAYVDYDNEYDDDMVHEEVQESEHEDSRTRKHLPKDKLVEDVADLTKILKDRKKNSKKYLEAFDPLNPPVIHDEESLEEYQIWLECESQHESVLKIQKTIDDARARNDFSALSKVQKQIINWFSPLYDEILQKQRAYIFKEDRVDIDSAVPMDDVDCKDSGSSSTGRNDVDVKDTKKTKNKKKRKKKIVDLNNTEVTKRQSFDAPDSSSSLLSEQEQEQQQQHQQPQNVPRVQILNQNHDPSRNRYGPYLCALPPKKLAIIVAHEAICHILTRMPNGHEGVPFISIAKRIGEAVEEEVAIHRALHKRYVQQRRSNSKQKASIESMMEELGENVDQDKAQVTLGTSSTSSSVSYEDNVSALFENENEYKTESAVNGLDPIVHERIEDNNDDFFTIETPATDHSGPNDITHKWAYAASHLRSYLKDVSKTNPTVKKKRVILYAIKRAKQVLERDEEWTVEDKIQLGAALFEILSQTAMVNEHGIEDKAFIYEKKWTRKNKTQSFVRLNERLYNMIVHDKLHVINLATTRFKPMIVQPKPWISHNHGGYMMLKADLLRFHGCNIQREVLKNADLSTIFDGLNALGRVKWKVNTRLLDVAQTCWEQNIPLGDIPTKTDYEIPTLGPIKPKPWSRGLVDKEDEAYKGYLQERQQFLDAEAKYQRIRQKNMDLNSLRCSAMLKLDQAQKFKDFDHIYFPYNMDFRGRAYPIPPHLSNVGSDLCRGMLMFAEAKPLGERGLYWLKVHLANFAGMDKVSFDDRAAFVDSNIDKIRECVKDPFVNRWWMSLEDPFQGLATCFEVVAALDSDDPTKYMCSLPVHMDGSCNGLQHYAALGRDKLGGKAVNLCPSEKPQDVYVGVMHEVIRRVEKEAERELDFDTSDLSALTKEQRKEFNNNRAAKLVNGLIDRGVVKRTVMTSVYGVTYIGAKQQIREKIEDKLEARGYDLDDHNQEIFHACGYLAKVTMDTIGDLFSGAKGTMNWLTSCARKICEHGFPVAWISPIGLPAIQPYRQKKSATLVTVLQTVTLTTESEDLPIHRTRQVSAFPPNFIHSLDSSHMLLTALEMDKRGLTFSAVHDSFWTHPCDIDEMHTVLREVFVDLYSKPILEDLKESWEMRYPTIEFPELPGRGDLDLQDVKQSSYFFQ